MISEGQNINYRSLIVGVDSMVPLKNGKLVRGINFDNAATTPPFCSVLEDIIKFSPWYSSIHRGSGYKSILSSNIYDSSREEILKFVKANVKTDTVIYVKNTTEAINKLSYRLCEDFKRCVVLSTDMEHHSNDLPWRKRFVVDYIKIDSLGMLDLNSLEKKLKKYEGRVKLVTITGASNVTGIVNPIHKIASIVHKHNSKLLVDGAQLVPHLPVRMRASHANEEDGIDFLVFSAHKMYAPFGTGILVGPRATFLKGEPDLVGGGTVDVVTHDIVDWKEPPEKEEAGTPNLMGVVALIASINTLKKIGMQNVASFEASLTNYALRRLREINGLEIYGDTAKDRVGIISFNIHGLHHSKVSKILSDEGGISVRNGCFCAQPYIQKLLKIKKDSINSYIKDKNLPREGMARISFGIYNDFNEIDKLCHLIIKIIKNKDYYDNKYD